jgi:hypothetical protein
MAISIGSLVKHIPTGDIVKVKSKSRVSLTGEPRDIHGDWLPGDDVKIRITECEPYTALPKEKSPYDKMRERNMEDAKKLPATPKEIGQHILWLKMAVIDRVEKIEKITGKEINTFRSGEKFGFTEHYVNLLMHYAYEAGKKNATESLTRNFEESTRDMKRTLNSIVAALDDNGLLPENDNY